MTAQQSNMSSKAPSDNLRVVILTPEMYQMEMQAQCSAQVYFDLAAKGRVKLWEITAYHKESTAASSVQTWTYVRGSMKHFETYEELLLHLAIESFDYKTQPIWTMANRASRTMFLEYSADEFELEFAKMKLEELAAIA